MFATAAIAARSAKLPRMFVPCPHCGFLLALIVTADGAAQSCPRCEGVLPGAGAAAAGTAPATTTNDPAESTGTQIETIAAGEAGDGIAAAPDPTSLDPAAPDPIATLIAVDAATPVAPAAAEPANARVGTAAPATRRRGRKPGTPSFARPSHEAGGRDHPHASARPAQSRRSSSKASISE